MNILHISPAYYPATAWGGPIFSVYGLNNALARLQGVQIKVLTTDSAAPKSKSQLNVPSIDPALFPDQIVIFTRRIAINTVSAELLARLPALIRWADVVHLTATYSFPTIPTLAFCKLYDKPLVWSPRGAILDAYQWDVPHPRIKRLWELFCNQLISGRRAVMHTTAENERIACEARIPEANVKIVPNGVDVLSTLTSRVWQPEGELRLMYLGRLSPKKGIENLLYALKILDDPTISLRIYGAGDSDYAASLFRLAKELGLSGRAVFMGEVIDAAKEAAFHVADLCVVPSHSENFCNVVAESLGHGVPVIASRGTPWEELNVSRCGWWVENSPQSLAETIRKARNQPLAEIGHRGWVRMSSMYSWDAVAMNMMNIYNSLIHKI